VTDAVARRAGRQLRQFRRSHPGIDLADYLIAATAEEEGASLVTLNVKHFPMFSGLRPPW
jgi:predicted nucleic acid-binding protein